MARRLPPREALRVGWPEIEGHCGWYRRGAIWGCAARPATASARWEHPYRAVTRRAATQAIAIRTPVASPVTVQPHGPGSGARPLITAGLVYLCFREGGFEGRGNAELGLGFGVPLKAPQLEPEIVMRMWLLRINPDGGAEAGFGLSSPLETSLAMSGLR
jgi:hypothetical protein